MAKAKTRVIKGLVFNFARIGTPELLHKKQADPENPLKNKEYIITAAIPPKTLKELKTTYKGMGIKSLANAEVIEPDAYKDRYCGKQEDGTYLFELPAAENLLNGDGDYTVMKFRVPASYQDGSDNGKQPVVIGTNGIAKPKQFDNNNVEVSREISMGNGTLGAIQVIERQSKEKGTGDISIVLDMKMVQVTELVEFAGGAVDMMEGADDFDVDERDIEGDSEVQDDFDMADGTTETGATKTAEKEDDFDE